MGYVHCMPARVLAMTHGLDNVISGTLETEAGEMRFRTRGHIVKAVNKHYRSSPWKPRRGDQVTIDGDVGTDGVVVDHIEPEPVPAGAPASHHPHLEAIAAITACPGASKTLRRHRGSTETRVRFAAYASRRDGRGRVAEEIVHAIHRHDDDSWHVISRRRADGTLATVGIDAEITVILARAAGRELLAGETAVEVDRRQQDDLRRAAVDPRPVATTPLPPPFDDCPF